MGELCTDLKVATSDLEKFLNNSLIIEISHKEVCYSYDVRVASVVCQPTGKTISTGLLIDGWIPSSLRAT